MDLVNGNQSLVGISRPPARVLYNERYKDKGVLFIHHYNLVPVT